ncbi:MAG: pyridoxamine 5'-phosphate oxidase family protein [Candidatus Limnocylindrales bacterium]|jgi:PPOX class probable F420-dependent enzyme
MKLDVATAELRSLLDAPSPATLTLYRETGEAITSPVWFRVHDEDFEVVVAATDHKLEHLRRDPRCVLLIFEAVRPFRGVQVRGRVTIEPDEGARTRLAIASRYLGPEGGRAYADLALRPPGFVVRLPVSAARAWDLADKLP